MYKQRSKKFIPLIIIVLIILLLVLVVRKNSTKRSSNSSSDVRQDIGSAKAKMSLHKEFLFPLRDNSDKIVTHVKYIIEGVELRDEIIVKGKRATSVKGRTFLIVNIKIANDFDRSIEMNARDYLRLTAKSNEKEFLAADIHNDPVQVQPISTKATRLGFPINDTDTGLKLHVGEIKGSKQIIELKFN